MDSCLLSKGLLWERDSVINVLECPKDTTFGGEGLRGGFGRNLDLAGQSVYLEGTSLESSVGHLDLLRFLFSGAD